MADLKLNHSLRYISFFSLLALIVLGLLWEMWLAPLRPGGSLLALKIMPLLIPLRGVWRGDLYTMQWSSMLILLYFMEGVVRAMSDPNTESIYLAIIQIVLTFIFYVAAIMYLRPAKKAAKTRQKQQSQS